MLSSLCCIPANQSSFIIESSKVSGEETATLCEKSERLHDGPAAFYDDFETIQSEADEAMGPQG